MRRHWRKSAFFCIAAAGVLIAALLLWPRVYASESKVFLRIGRETVTLDPSATVGETLPISRTRDGEITSVMEILGSRQIAQLVVDQVGVDRINQRPMSYLQRVSRSVKAWFPSRADSSADAEGTLRVAESSAVKWVLDSTSANCLKESTVISIRCDAPSPGLARGIVAAMTNAFRDEYIRVNQTGGVRQFFETTLEQLGRDLHDLRSRMRDEMDELGIVTLDGKQESLLARLSAVELAIQEEERQACVSQATIADLERRIDTLPGTISASTEELEGETRARIQEQFYEFEISERKQMAQLTAAHPLAEGLARQHEDLKKSLEMIPERVVRTIRVPNPTRQVLVQQLETERVAAEGTRAAQKALATQFQKLREEIRRFNESEPKIRQLEQEIVAAEANFQARSEQLALARIQAEMDTAHISNVNIVQPATFDPEPVAPKRRLVFGAGMALILILSLALPFLVEYSRPTGTVASVENLASVLPNPVLGSIPRFQTHEPIVN